MLMCFNTSDRSPMYNQIINWWLRNSTYNIVIIDSGNFPFARDIYENSRTRIKQFDQTEQGFSGKESSTILEINSLKQAVDIIREYEFVIKLTCKYKLPELQNTLDSTVITPRIDFIFQSKSHKSWQYTELFIIRTTKFTEMVSNLAGVSGLHMEQRMDLWKQENTHHLILPLLRNTATYHRGDNLLLTHL